MATSASGEFEVALKRLEEIVQKLEGDVSLDESVALFKEGKTLAGKCERLLTDAQASIEAAARGDAAPPVAEAVAARAPAGRATLFASVDDADPDL
jgi:exodeoxyribonuclease VII small subunit